MTRIIRYLRSDIGQKQLVGISGLLISGFILTHMAANMLLLLGPDIYNTYAHVLEVNPFLPVAELSLLAIFLLHVTLAILVTVKNRKARPRGNAVRSRTDKAARFGSQSMILTGLVVLVFLVLHLIALRFGEYYVTAVNGVEMRDLYRLVMEKLSQPLYVGWYLFSLIVLWVHTCHGFSAVFQTLGVASARNRKLKNAGYALASIIILGFMSQPLYLMWLASAGGQ